MITKRLAKIKRTRTLQILDHSIFTTRTPTIFRDKSIENHDHFNKVTSCVAVFPDLNNADEVD